MTDLRQSSVWANYLKLLGWKIEKINSTFVYIKHFPVLGNFAKLQRPNVLSDKIINFIESKYHPFSFSIEPSNNLQVNLLQNNNFKISKFSSLPTRTLVISLQKSEKEILKSFSGKVRYNIMRASKLKHVTIVESHKISDFTNFWRQNFEKKKLLFLSQQKNIIALHKTFNKNSKILLAREDNQIIAVLFLLFFDKTAYYMYAAANDEGRKKFAPTLLTWHAILLSKKLGMKEFDFDGIYDKRFPVKTWLGFTKFKYGFSKNEIEYPGMFVKSRFNIKIL
jgi:lipid II:glycine glycyltransferase (peptidoglycan interpeptide bridge formation enzyme)